MLVLRRPGRVHRPCDGDHCWRDYPLAEPDERVPELQQQQEQPCPARLDGGAMSCCHAPSANPRQKDMCVKCGRRFDDRPAESVPVLERDLRWEREFVREAGRLVGLANGVEPMEQGAAARTLPGPVLLPPGRDLKWEAIEEALDGRNYVVWKAYEAFLADDVETVHRMMRALGFFILAHRELAGE